VLKSSVRRRFGRGEVVFHQGDPGDSLHVVVRGLLVARSSTPLGDVVTLNIFPPGAVFGELALLSTESRRTATVVALEQSETLMLGRDAFDGLRRRNRNMDAFLVAVLTERNRALSEHLSDLVFNPAEQRIYRRLLLLASVAGDGDTGWVHVTQEEIASLAGTTRATVNRSLRRAAHDGLIELGRSRFRIVDPARLAAKAPRPPS
jgi:CRP-like cAMP-binding protein